ncbi:MAG: hypothetical protein K2X98_00750 [Alphaproteobacteria bacterium]|nr:hypothetical protein [Alphaproteobacteria bacterium]
MSFGKTISSLQFLTLSLLLATTTPGNASQEWWETSHMDDNEGNVQNDEDQDEDGEDFDDDGEEDVTEEGVLLELEEAHAKNAEILENLEKSSEELSKVQAEHLDMQRIIEELKSANAAARLDHYNHQAVKEKVDDLYHEVNDLKSELEGHGKRHSHQLRHHSSSTAPETMHLENTNNNDKIRLSGLKNKKANDMPPEEVHHIIEDVSPETTTLPHHTPKLSLSLTSSSQKKDKHESLESSPEQTETTHKKPLTLSLSKKSSIDETPKDEVKDEQEDTTEDVSPETITLPHHPPKLSLSLTSSSQKKDKHESSKSSPEQTETTPKKPLTLSLSKK